MVKLVHLSPNFDCWLCGCFTGQCYGCIVKKKVILLEELKRDTPDFGGSCVEPAWSAFWGFLDVHLAVSLQLNFWFADLSEFMHPYCSCMYRNGLPSLCMMVSLMLFIQALLYYTLRKKGTKSVTGAVPFQKVHFCT